MKRICFVDYDMAVTGGAEQVTASLANELCKEYDVYIYSINNTGEIAYQLDERIHYYKQLKNVTRLRQMITGVFRPFCKMVREEKIDTVVMMGNYPALIVSFCRFFTRAKFIFCDHGALINQWHQKDITAIRYWVSFVSHRVVTLTEQSRNDYIQKFHLSKKKVSCIYNWISPELLKLHTAYDSTSKCILTVGRFGKEKGYDLLLEAAKQVLPKHLDWQWHLYGIGETLEAMKERAKEYGLDKQICFMGNVPEVYKQYYKYAFLVLPSYREGLPLVLLEASACGLPMISFDIATGPNEVIVHGENGVLVPPYDCEVMANAIDTLICDVALRKKYSDGTQEYLDKFAYERILEDWKKLL